MRTTEEIIVLFRQRSAERSDVHAAQQDIRDIVNGDKELPTDELSEDTKPAVANLIAQGGEQDALRLASVLPTLTIPPVNPTSKPSQRRASDARRAVLGWWEANLIDSVNFKRALHLLYDGETPVVISPDFDARMPKWEVRDPMSAYPPPVMGLTPVVADCIFTYTQTYVWLRANYPLQAATMPRTARTPDATVTILEYYDAEDCVTVCIGAQLDRPMRLTQPPGRTAAFPTSQTAGSTSWVADPSSDEYEYVELDRYAHGYGMAPVTYPTRITYDRLQGQFNQLIGLYMMQARLMALAVIGTDRSILKETWLRSNVQGSPAKIIQQADARTGKVGIVVDGELVQFGPDPGFMTMPVIDRIERNLRVTGSFSPDMAGESGPNIRTGRRGEQILSATTDFLIQRYQKILGTSLRFETQIAIAVAKRWWGNRELSFDVDWKGAQGLVTYRPNKVFEQRRVSVSFGQAGADANQVVLGGGQRIGLKSLSRRSFMEIDQWVPDVEAEADRITVEALDDAILAGIQQRATQLDQGGIPLDDLIRIRELVGSDKADLVEAIRTAQREAQQRQSEAAPAGAPETQLGMAAPGQGANQPVAATQGPNADQANILSMLSNLRLSQRTSPTERAPVPAGGAA